MAVVFTPMGESQVVLGGEINPSSGIAGPFPRYSISKEVVTKNGVFLGERFSISLSGTALITESASMLTSGARQSQIHAIITELLTIDGKTGRLEISPYGGAANTIQFNDAVCTSIDVPDQDDDSQGVQSQDYSITFEASDLAGHSSGSDYSENLDDISENWECAITDGTYSQDAEGGSNVYRTFTISHTVSATCRPKRDGTTLKSGWIEAKQWVDNRIASLGNDPFVGANMKDLSYGTPQDLDIDSELPSSFAAYNQVTQNSQSITDGSYSVTRTWVVSKFSGRVSMNFDFNEDLASAFQTASISVEVAGYESLSSSAKPNTDAKTDKYTNAKTFFDNNIIGNIYTFVNDFYNSVNTLSGTTLRSVPVAESQSHNQTNGTISYNATFDDATVDFTGAVSQSVNVSFDNEDGGNETVAVIPVIGRSDGPIFQDMNTTGPRGRSITVELQMDRNNRSFSDKPDAISYIESNYKPVISGPEKAYRQTRNENWDHMAGKYTITVEYSFNTTPDSL